MSNQWPPADLDRDELTHIVLRVLERDDIDLLDWTVQAVAYDASNPVSGGVYRIHGETKAPRETFYWSVILKVLRTPEPTASVPGFWASSFSPTRSMPSPPMFWKREALAYQSGMLNDLPRGILAPHCFAASEKSDTCYWLWLEDVSGQRSQQRSWIPSRYRQVAGHLGQFNGSYLTGLSIPRELWLASHWMRSWLWHLEQEGGLDQITRMVSEDPVLQNALPASVYWYAVVTSARQARISLVPRRVRPSSTTTASSVKRATRVSVSRLTWAAK
jgi:hypothetical protein